VQPRVQTRKRKTRKIRSRMHLSAVSGETEGGNATPTLIEFATSIISGKRKGSSIDSAKRRPARVAAGKIQKRTRLSKRLTEKEKKQARDELQQMSGDASIDSHGVKNTRKDDDADEWTDQMMKGFEKGKTHWPV